MGLGYGAGVAGFIVICLAILIFGFVIAGWIGWKYWKNKQQKTNPILDLVVKMGLFSMLMIPMYVAFSIAMIVISNTMADRKERKYVEQIFLQLDEPLSYGEIILPKGTWINRDFDADHSLEDMSDIRQGLSTARFSSVIKVAQFEANAFEVNDDLYVELARDYTVSIEGERQTCPRGWVIKFSDGGIDLKQYRYHLNFDWFKPSQWTPVSCFDYHLIVVDSI